MFVVCPALQYPQHGQVDYTNQQRTVGTTATYSCNSVFVTNGNKVRECQIDATWSGSAPTCTSEYSTNIVMSLTHATDSFEFSLCVYL